MDIGVPLLAMEAMVTIMGRRGTKRVDLWQVSGKPAASRLAAGDLVVELEVEESGPNVISGYKKLSRGAAHWPVAGVAIVADIGSDGLCRGLHIATGCVSYGYSRHDEVGRGLVGKPWDESSAEIVSTAVSKEIHPRDSVVLGSAEHQRAMLKALTWEAAVSTFSDARGGR